MLNIYSNNNSSIRRHLPAWARVSSEQWLQQHSTSVRYKRLHSSRISRARQTMEDGGINNDSFKEDYILPPFNKSECYSRRRSCPQKQTVDPDFTEYLHPSEIVRPVSSCGFYKNMEAARCDSPESSPDEVDLSVPRSKLFTRSTELLGSVRRSVKKYTRNKMAENPPVTEPKLPNVLKNYNRGVSPEPKGIAIGRRLSLGQEPSTDAC